MVGYDRLGRISTVAEDATGGTRTFVYRDGGDLQLDYEELPGFFDNGTTRRMSRTYATSGTVGRYTGFTFGPSGSPLHNTAYAYSASTGRLDTVSRSGHTTVSYGYLSGSDHISSVTMGSWSRTQTWESGREAMSTISQNWTGSGSRSVAEYTNDFDWRLNRDAVTLTGELASQQGHANGIKTKYWNFLTGDNWDREEVRETRTEQLDTGTEMTARHREWTYDAAQNRSVEERTGGWSTSYTNNNRDQLTALSGSESASVSHDDDGNLTGDGTWSYTYDAENRLIKMQQNVGGTLRLEFKYDYLGRRIEKAVFPTSGSSTADKRIRFVYDGWNLVAELDAKNANAVSRTYTWGLDASETLGGAGGVGGLLRIEEGSSKYLPVYDSSNNVTGLLRDDGSTSTLVASYTYGPFGEKLQADWAAGGFTDNNPFRYSTKYTDSETGLVYYGLRYYHPKFARFINRDPIEEEGGLNLYNFVGNNAANRSDYLGMCELRATHFEWIPGSTISYRMNAQINPFTGLDEYEEQEIYEPGYWNLVYDYVCDPSAPSGEIGTPGGGSPGTDGGSSGPGSPTEPTDPANTDHRTSIPSREPVYNGGTLAKFTVTAKRAPNNALQRAQATAAQLGWNGFTTNLSESQQLYYGKTAQDILALQAQGKDVTRLWQAVVNEVPGVITDSGGLMMSSGADAARSQFLQANVVAGATGVALGAIISSRVPNAIMPELTSASMQATLAQNGWTVAGSGTSTNGAFVRMQSGSTSITFYTSTSGGGVPTAQVFQNGQPTLKIRLGGSTPPTPTGKGGNP